mmetsp:Transcript_16877/g.41840  ORF Transcript_16877/g.41840 Transcript_16877/m.41840 type:complete len:287 (-) Transcript_16877:1714-2574(-)
MDENIGYSFSHCERSSSEINPAPNASSTSSSLLQFGFFRSSNKIGIHVLMCFEYCTSSSSSSHTHSPMKPLFSALVKPPPGMPCSQSEISCFSTSFAGRKPVLSSSSVCIMASRFFSISSRLSRRARSMYSSSPPSPSAFDLRTPLISCSSSSSRLFFSASVCSWIMCARSWYSSGSKYQFNSVTETCTAVGTSINPSFKSCGIRQRIMWICTTEITIPWRFISRSRHTHAGHCTVRSRLRTAVTISARTEPMSVSTRGCNTFSVRRAARDVRNVSYWHITFDGAF